jgi:hypothetical protein
MYFYNSRKEEGLVENRQKMINERLESKLRAMYIVAGRISKDIPPATIASDYVNMTRREMVEKYNLLSAGYGIKTMKFAIDVLSVILQKEIPEYERLAIAKDHIEKGREKQKKKGIGVYAPSNKRGLNYLRRKALISRGVKKWTPYQEEYFIGLTENPNHQHQNKPCYRTIARELYRKFKVNRTRLALQQKNNKLKSKK